MSRLHLAASCAAFACALAGAMPSYAATPPHYAALDLGTLLPDGVLAISKSVDDMGRVAATVRYADGTVTGAITGPDGAGATEWRFPGAQQTEILAMSNKGAVAGVATIGGIPKGFMVGSGGRNQQIYWPWGGMTQVVPQAINSNGRVAGWQTDESGQSTYGFITHVHGRKNRDIGTLDGVNSWVYAINDHGEATGSYQLDRGAAYVIVTDSHGHPRSLGVGGFGYAINDQAQIAGFADVNGRWCGFITAPQAGAVRCVADIDGSNNTVLYALNDGGQAVGDETVLIGGEWVNRAIVTDVTGQQLYRLETLTELPDGVALESARTINARGQIAAEGTDQHLYLLTPD